MVKSSGETKEPQHVSCGLTAEMVNSTCEIEPHLDKLEEHQSECEVVQYKQETDKEVSLNAAEQEVVFDPVVIQGNACEELESANVHEIDTALIDVFPEVKQTNVTTTETEEHCTDIKNEPHDCNDLEGPIIKFLGDLDEVENETKTTSCPEPQTSQKDLSSPNPSQSLHVDGDDMQEKEETRINPKARDDHAEMLKDTMLEHIQETCFSSEIQLQAIEEPESLEPPAKKRLRKRMGMCGLGDRKRKFPFDGQHCRQGLTGKQMEEQAFKGNEVVQHLYNTEFESDGNTPMYHEGTSGPAGKEEDAEVLKAKENNGAAVMDDDRTTRESEKENGYALRHNMSKWTALMKDKVTTDESPKENTDVLKAGILEEINGTIVMDDKGNAEQVIFFNKLNLLEQISTNTVMEQTLPTPTSGKNVQDELSASTAPNDHKMETATCEEEPNLPVTEMTNSGQDMVFNVQHEVLSEKQNHLGDDRVDEGLYVIEAEVAQEVNSSSICARVEVSECSAIVNKEVQMAPSGLDEREINIEEKHPPDMAAIEKHDPNRPDLSCSTVKALNPLFVDIMDTLPFASTYETHNAKTHGENEESTDHTGGDAEDIVDISEPLATPAGQEIRMHVTCDTSVTPTVAKQQVCNPTLTSAASELPQEADLSVPPFLYSMTDSQIHKIALSMELEDQLDPEDYDQQEDATELVRGLIRELSSLKHSCFLSHHMNIQSYRDGGTPRDGTLAPWKTSKGSKSSPLCPSPY
ncbi:uncharacterized protein si:ch211-286b5.2 isoform X2 [Tachysurus fulvidraco]|uniref:uncharacterized protein si:ch211-286b5.2 isoform X2 n=1 Tax=Tachysurus fulvidraco TaxID=1234273 RepID=UPI001FEDEF53|nr:uncharacterized protein si:ch211-286b5.2 isoform X2 [Tachysurus fulvidraco]